MTGTPKARALGAALRQAREDQGLTLRAFGERIHRDIAQMSRWETGQKTPKPEQVAQYLTALDITGKLFEEIVSLAHGTDAPLWVASKLPEQRQQLTALLDCEQNARKITAFSSLLVPGLLQTSSYGRAIMEDAGVPAGELPTRVAVRIGRGDVLKRQPNPVQMLALVGEAALRQVIRSRDILAEQLRYLLDVARWPNVDLRVIPLSRGWHPGLEGSFMLFESDQAVPVVHMENRRSGLFLHEDDDVAAYQLAVEQISRVALSGEESARYIAGLVNGMEKQHDHGTSSLA